MSILKDPNILISSRRETERERGRERGGGMEKGGMEKASRKTSKETIGIYIAEELCLLDCRSLCKIN